VADILRYSEAAGQAPDQALLEQTLKTTLHAVLEAAKIRDEEVVATLGPVLGELRSSWSEGPIIGWSGRAPAPLVTEATVVIEASLGAAKTRSTPCLCNLTVQSL
jgi:hypothetical protein